MHQSPHFAINAVRAAVTLALEIALFQAITSLCSPPENPQRRVRHTRRERASVKRGHPVERCTANGLNIIFPNVEGRTVITHDVEMTGQINAVCL